MASRKKKPSIKSATQDALELSAFRQLQKAEECLDHMRQEMSPAARISWRERAVAHTALANSWMNYARLLKGK